MVSSARLSAAEASLALGRREQFACVAAVADTTAASRERVTTSDWSAEPLAAERFTIDTTDAAAVSILHLTPTAAAGVHVKVKRLVPGSPESQQHLTRRPRSNQGVATVFDIPAASSEHVMTDDQPNLFPRPGPSVEGSDARGRTWNTSERSPHRPVEEHLTLEPRVKNPSVRFGAVMRSTERTTIVTSL